MLNIYIVKEEELSSAQKPIRKTSRKKFLKLFKKERVNVNSHIQQGLGRHRNEEGKEMG
jgi:hypothetical protein